MKTAMTELMQWMTKNEFMVNMAFIDKVNECFEKEKEQIIEAYENGVGDENERNLSGQFTNAEEYYNQTYNNEKD